MSICDKKKKRKVWIVNIYSQKFRFIYVSIRLTCQILNMTS